VLSSVACLGYLTLNRGVPICIGTGADFDRNECRFASGMGVDLGRNTHQEWAENFSRRTAPRFGGAAAQRNETERVLKAHASEKRYRRDSQRTGTWARDETDEISRLKPGRAIALFHGRCLQCETISKSARIPDDNACSEPCLRARTFHFPGYGIVTGANLFI
jgi:hypothetical protein